MICSGHNFLLKVSCYEVLVGLVKGSMISHLEFDIFDFGFDCELLKVNELMPYAWQNYGRSLPKKLNIDAS